MNYARWVLRALALFSLLVSGVALHAANVTTNAQSRATQAAGSAALVRCQ